MIVLSAKQKILIQLSESKEAHQEKLAHMLSTTQSAISKALKKLDLENLVKRRESAEVGKRKRVRLYGITNDGEKLAVEIKNNIAKEEIVTRSLSGARQIIKFSSLNKFLVKKLNRDFTTIEIITALEKDSLDLTVLARKSLITQLGSELPELKHFYGRKIELQQVSDFMSSGSKILALKGIAGIGKTLLVTKSLEKYSDWRIFWFRAHEFSSIQTLLRYLADFLLNLRKSGLRAYLYSGKVDLGESLLVVEESLSKTKALLIFDDAHKMQKELGEYCRELFKILRKEPVKVIVAGRFIPRIYDKKDVLEGYVREFTLEGLDRKAAAELLEEKGIPASEKIYEFTKGHPLLLELVKSELTAKGDIHSFLRSEIYEKLAEEDRRILSFASVFRTPFKHRAFLENNLDFDRVNDLVEKSLLQRSGESYYTHDLIKSFVYTIIPDHTKVSNHLAASEYYLKEGSELGGIEAVYHLIKSLEEERALELLTESGESMVMKGCLNELMSVLNEFKITAPEILTLKGSVLMVKGNWDEALNCYNKALKLSKRAGDNKQSALALRKFGEILTLRAEYKLATENLEKALKISEIINDINGVLNAQYHLGRVYWLTGELDKALATLNDSLRLSTEIGLHALTGKIYTDLGNVYYLKGNYEETIKLLKKSLRVASTVGDEYEKARVCHNLGAQYGIIKKFNSAIKWLEKSINIATRIGHVRMLGYALADAAESYVAIGKLARAKEYADRAMTIFGKLAEKRMIAGVHRSYGLVYSKAGKLSKAIKHFNESVKIAKEINDLEVLSQTLLDFGKLYKAKGNVVKAREKFSKALRIYKKLGNELKVREVEKELKAL